MFRRIRWMLIAIGLVALATGGTSIFSLPEHEVLYEPRPALVTCTTSGCISILTLEVGNSGTQEQEHVRVRLRTEALRTAILPMTVRNFGKVDRTVSVRDDGEVRIFDLGRVKPQQRIELTLVYQDGDRSTRRDWHQMLVGVEAAAGEVRPGSAAMVTLGRYFYAIFGGCH